MEEDAVADVDDRTVSRIVKLARAQLTLEDELAQQKRKMEEVEEHLAELKFIRLPLAMKEAGVSELKLSDGSQVTIVSDIKTSIPAKHRDAAFDWLRKNGHGSIIKNDVVVSFGRGEEEEAAMFIETVAADEHTYKHKEDVHWQTLKAFVKEQLENGVDVPADLFGLFEYNVSKVKPK
jgi:hypothetical protein